VVSGGAGHWGVGQFIATHFAKSVYCVTAVDEASQPLKQSWSPAQPTMHMKSTTQPVVLAGATEHAMSARQQFLWTHGAHVLLFVTMYVDATPHEVTASGMGAPSSLSAASTCGPTPPPEPLLTHDASSTGVQSPSSAG
jgi:hypothetical protein